MIEKEKKQIITRITNALERIRPYLVQDGGDISLEEITDELVVKVKLHGACHGCPFSYQTLKTGVEQALRQEVPEIKELVAVD